MKKTAKKSSKLLLIPTLLLTSTFILSGCNDKTNDEQKENSKVVCAHVDLNPFDHQCDICGEVLGQHEFGTWKLTKAPTYEEEGSESRECACGKIEARKIEKLNHTYSSGDNWSKDYVDHWHACLDSGFEEKIYGIDVGPHSFGNWSTKNPATFESKEIQERMCSVCGYVETQEVGEVLPHNYSSDWQKNEESHWHVCIDVGYTHIINDSGAHIFGEYVKDEDASTESKLVEHRFCSVCNYEDIKETEVETIATIEEKLQNIIEKMPAKTDFNPSVNGYVGTSRLHEIYDRLTSDQLSKLNNSLKFEIEDRFSISESLNYVAGYQYKNKSPYFINNSKSTRSGQNEHYEIFDDDTYGDCLKLNIEKDIDPDYGQICSFAKKVGSGGTEYETQHFLDENILCGVVSIKSDVPGKYIIQNNASDFRFEIKQANTWETFLLTADYITASRLRSTDYGVLKSVGAPIKDGNYISLSNIICIKKPINNCTSLTLGLSNGYSIGSAYDNKFGYYGSNSLSIDGSMYMSHPRVYEQIISSDNGLYSYEYKVVDNSKTSSISDNYIVGVMSDLSNEDFDTLVYPVFISNKTKLQLKLRTSGEYIVNSEVAAGWHYFSFSNLETIKKIKTGGNELIFYVYLPGAQDGTKVLFGSPALIKLPEPPAPIDVESKKTLKMTGDYFKVVNFSDVQFQNVDQLAIGSYSRITIEKMIEQEQPSIITFSGDIADASTTMECYQTLCDFMDTFKIPYYMVFGNHDRVHATAEQLASIINNSQYGFIEKGPSIDGTYGNYVLDIKNKNDELVHKILMMDSRAGYNANEDEIDYVENIVNGVKYYTYNDRKIYGHPKYDNIKGEQINWYKNQIFDFSKESTIITHIPLRQYTYAFEEYMTAKNSRNQAAIDAMKPVGLMRQGECVCSSAFDSGLFDTMLELGSTKNFIACHDHYNDFSLVYNGIRLTYGVKTGNGYEWMKDGSMNGCTCLSISSDGVGSVNQVYLDLVA